MTAIVSERLTPTGVVAGTYPPNTPDWYALRRTGIGSSDVPAILGLSRYRSAAHVWAEKRGELGSDESGEAARWGTLLEDIVAREWADRRGTQVHPVPTLRHHEVSHRMANPDRLVPWCPDLPDRVPAAPVCGLEVKTRSAWSAGSWREDVPDDVLAQVLWQLEVTGLDHMHVACLVGGQRLVEHTVHPDPVVQAYIVRETDALWAAVQTGVRPVVDEAALLLDLLDRLYPDRAGDVEIDPTVAARLRAAYDLGKQTEAAGKEEALAVKAALVELLGSGDVATVDGQPVATYRPVERTDLDRARLRKEFPDAWAACATTKKTRPVLRWK